MDAPADHDSTLDHDTPAFVRKSESGFGRGSASTSRDSFLDLGDSPLSRMRGVKRRGRRSKDMSKDIQISLLSESHLASDGTQLGERTGGEEEDAGAHSIEQWIVLDLSQIPGRSQFDKNTEVCFTLFNLVKRHYHHQFERRFLGKAAIVHLMDAAKVGAEWGDHIRSDIRIPLAKEWERLRYNFSVPLMNSRFRSMAEGNSRLLMCLRWPARSLLFSSIALTAEGMAGYIRAHEEVLRHSHARGAALSPLVMDLVEERLRQAKSRIDELSRRHPAVMVLARSLLAARVLLHDKRAALLRLENRGLLQEADVAVLVSRVDSRIAALDYTRFNPLVAQIKLEA